MKKGDGRMYEEDAGNPFGYCDHRPPKVSVTRTGSKVRSDYRPGWLYALYRKSVRECTSRRVGECVAERRSVRVGQS